MIPEQDAADMDRRQGQARHRLLGQGGYYDLVRSATRRRRLDDVAIVRVEQLYPFPHKAFAAEMKRIPNATEVVWCQDEPQNQGAWFFIQHHPREHARRARSWATRAAGLGLAGRGLRPPRTRSSRRRWSMPPSASLKGLSHDRRAARLRRGIPTAHGIPRGRTPVR